jgi:hypothetical protein
MDRKTNRNNREIINKVGHTVSRMIISLLLLWIPALIRDVF